MHRPFLPLGTAASAHNHADCLRYHSHAKPPSRSRAVYHVWYGLVVQNAAWSCTYRNLPRCPVSHAMAGQYMRQCFQPVALPAATWRARCPTAGLRPTPRQAAGTPVRPVPRGRRGWAQQRTPAVPNPRLAGCICMKERQLGDQAQKVRCCANMHACCTLQAAVKWVAGNGEVGCKLASSRPAATCAIGIAACPDDLDVPGNGLVVGQQPV